MSKDFIPNERTQRMMVLLREMLETANNEGKPLILGGGIALELQAATIRGVNNLTRNHHDLDISPLEKDQDFWRTWFKEKGYNISGNGEIKNETVAFVAHSPDSKRNFDQVTPAAFSVDVYGVNLDDNGILGSNWQGKETSYGISLENATHLCDWMGQKVRVVNWEHLLQNKRNYSKNLRPIDIADHRLFGIDPVTGQKTNQT